jgi:hypothetical protein
MEDGRKRKEPPLGGAADDAPVTKVLCPSFVFCFTLCGVFFFCIFVLLDSLPGCIHGCFSAYHYQFYSMPHCFVCFVAVFSSFVLFSLFILPVL